MFPDVDWRSQLEAVRRSLAMEPGEKRLPIRGHDWDALLREVQDVRRRLDTLQRGLAELAEALVADER